MIQFDFNGRVAVITGGARGIGRAVADRLAASGAKVCLWDLLEPGTSEGPFGTAAGSHAFEQVDVTDEAQVARAAEAMLARFGRVDILLNGAGVTGPTKPTVTFSYAEWQRIVRINLDSTFLCSRALIPAMTAQGYGRIVNIASVAGKQGNPEMAAYSASKAAVIGLTKALGLELAQTGILVNCITPGLVRTELLKEMSDEAIAQTLTRIPLGRPGKIEEIAAQILWIASEECGFATGAAFDASGGRSSF